MRIAMDGSCCGRRLGCFLGLGLLASFLGVGERHRRVGPEATLNDEGVQLCERETIEISKSLMGLDELLPCLRQPALPAELHAGVQVVGEDCLVYADGTTKEFLDVWEYYSQLRGTSHAGPP